MCCRSVVLQNKQTNKLIDKESRFVVTRGKRSGRGNSIKMGERYKLPVVG